MAKRRKRQKSIIVRVLVLFVAIYMIFTLADLFSELNNKRNELNSVIAKREAKQLEIEELKILIDEGKESEIIEKAARDRLGYVYSDEEIFLDISGN